MIYKEVNAWITGNTIKWWRKGVCGSKGVLIFSIVGINPVIVLSQYGHRSMSTTVYVTIEIQRYDIKNYKTVHVTSDT